METITIPKSEYYNLILTDYTDDLTEYSINNEEDWNIEESRWDHV